MQQMMSFLREMEQQLVEQPCYCLSGLGLRHSSNIDAFRVQCAATCETLPDLSPASEKEMTASLVFQSILKRQWLDAALEVAAE
jgi:hypothetical protein